MHVLFVGGCKARGGGGGSFENENDVHVLTGEQK